MERIELPEDFKEFLRLLDSKGVDYLLVGGYAVAYHGRPRGTIDIDFWVRQSPENAKRIVNLLHEFGFADTALDSSLFERDDQIVRMGCPPVRIEVMTTISGVSFDPCYARKVRALIDGVLVDVISREDLLLNKRASGRPKDLADLDEL